ncbi:hypothetical protein BC938DRAFT_472815 [Jimgerdemannia flammicorona]|uniref:Uncharacterized protein n=1 Tax=Jimgerdemannia flammicorona TaxID=994334 RepID=A0A433QTT1_9FUNG|nr:hypothetical protein BC938DRAFT_472815 [Jimgerdemannia flammicorona]
MPSRWLPQGGQPEADQRHGPQVLDGSRALLDLLIALLIILHGEFLEGAHRAAGLMCRFANK